MEKGKGIKIRKGTFLESLKKLVNHMLQIIFAHS